MDDKKNKPKGLQVILSPELNEMLKIAASKKELSLSEYAYFSIILSLKNDGHNVNSYIDSMQKHLEKQNKKDELLKYFSDNCFIFPKVNHEECECYLTQNDLLTFFNTRRSQFLGYNIEKFIAKFKRYNNLKTKLTSYKEDGVWRTLRVTVGIQFKPGISIIGDDK
jgi:hypothetical protein